ncbi:hypothetical protein CDG60_12210 [Acinetobacter chinensis]|uniref:Phage tail protein n=1 Tax=Acinetobacter chinensis TaxID=2004650 RepID=A0A3B7LXZ9_9GAMM|nr:hypothetical protein [Acinetobacter chinensis]AXY57261.1 hypothetical protein CDG60_12210 [Acinetobacter chinensis]
MNFKAKVEVGVRYKFLISNKNGELNSESEWSDNLFLDAGLDMIGGLNNAGMSHLWVGTGNSEPKPGDTTLQAPLATTDSFSNEITGVNTSTAPFYYYARRTYTYALGAVVGDLSETGLGDNLGRLCSRALIKDSAGEATTITILDDEILSCIVESRVYPKTGYAGSFNLLNKFDEVISTHTVTGNAVIVANGVAWYLASAGFDYSLLSAKVMQNTCNPSTVSYPNTSGSVTQRMGQSRPDLRTVKGFFTLALSAGNDWPHKSFMIPVGGLLSITSSGAVIGFKYDVDPPVTKNNQKSLRYGFELSWGRYTGA